MGLAEDKYVMPRGCSGYAGQCRPCRRWIGLGLAVSSSFAIGSSFVSAVALDEDRAVG